MKPASGGVLGSNNVTTAVKSMLHLCHGGRSGLMRCRRDICSLVCCMFEDLSAVFPRELRQLYCRKILLCFHSLSLYFDAENWVFKFKFKKFIVMYNRKSKIVSAMKSFCVVILACSSSSLFLRERRLASRGLDSDWLITRGFSLACSPCLSVVH